MHRLIAALLITLCGNSAFAELPLALDGLDPLTILAGQARAGQPEIGASANGRRYLFVSKASRAEFLRAPASYLHENRICPVMPGVRAAGDVWLVQQGRILLFGSAQCRQHYQDDPAEYAAALQHTGLNQQSVQFRSGALNIHAWWMTPPEWDQSHAAVMVHGSGAVDRDHAWTMELARALVHAGIAVLLPDKRGCGRSDGDWRTANFATLAADAAAAQAWVKSTAADARVGYVGLSQGGTVAPMAAALHGGDFVVSLSSSATPYFETAWHQYTNDLHRAGLAPDARNAALHIHSLLERAAATGSKAARTDFLNAYASVNDSALSAFLRGLPEHDTDWRWAWWADGVATLDPLDYWSALQVPALIAHGRLDQLQNVSVIRSQRRLAALPNPPVIFSFDAVGHDLRDGRTISPVVVSTVSNWITALH